jgi:hypothetical protein
MLQGMHHTIVSDWVWMLFKSLLNLVNKLPVVLRRVLRGCGPPQLPRARPQRSGHWLELSSNMLHFLYCKLVCCMVCVRGCGPPQLVLYQERDPNILRNLIFLC